MNERRELEQEVVRLLEARNLILAVAESCTGGLLGGCLTDVPGSSRVFAGGVIAYSNGVKSALLDVDEQLLAEHGAVSAVTARAMAGGVRARTGADIGVSITGIAGPLGGTGEKPVGLVFIGLADGDTDDVRELRFDGDRQTVRRAAVHAALEMLRDSLRDRTAERMP